MAGPTSEGPAGSSFCTTNSASPPSISVRRKCSPWQSATPFSACGQQGGRTPFAACENQHATPAAAWGQVPTAGGFADRLQARIAPDVGVDRAAGPCPAAPAGRAAPLHRWCGCRRYRSGRRSPRPGPRSRQGSSRAIPRLASSGRAERHGQRHRRTLGPGHGAGDGRQRRGDGRGVWLGIVHGDPSSCAGVASAGQRRQRIQQHRFAAPRRSPRRSRRDSSLVFQRQQLGLDVSAGSFISCSAASAMRRASQPSPNSGPATGNPSSVPMAPISVTATTGLTRFGRGEPAGLQGDEIERRNRTDV